MILAGLLPLARLRQTTMRAVPQRDRVHDGLRSPAEPRPGTRSHVAPPSGLLLDADTESLQHEVDIRIDEHRLEPVGDECRSLETVARNEQHDAVLVPDFAAANSFSERTERNRRRRLAEHTSRLGEEFDVLRNLRFSNAV